MADPKQQSAAGANKGGNQAQQGQARQGTSAQPTQTRQAARPVPGERTTVAGNKPSAKPREKGHPMKVRATQTGYYDLKRRREGDVFTIDSSEFSERWMEAVDDRTRERTTTPQQAVNKVSEEIKGARQAERNGDDDPLGAGQ